MTTVNKAANIRATIDATWGSGQGKLRLDEIFRDDPTRSRPLTGSALLDDKSLMVTSTFDKGVFFISKLNHLGAVDLTFGVEGRVTGSFLPNEQAAGGPIAAGNDGRLFMAGSTTNGKAGEVLPAILCLDRKGNRVSEFGDNGQVIINHTQAPWPVIQGPRFVLALPDNSVVVGVDHYTGAPFNVKLYKAFLYKFNAEGQPENAFGKNGCVEIVGIQPSSVSSLSDGCVLDDGRLLFAGYEKRDNDLNSAGLIVMLNADGTLNQAFGEPQRPGFLVVDPSSRGAELHTVKQRAPGKFTASGYTKKSNIWTNQFGMLIAFDEKGGKDYEINGGEITRPLLPEFGDNRVVNWTDHATFNHNLVFSGADEAGNFVGCLISSDGNYSPDFYDGRSIIREDVPTLPLSTLHYQQDPSKLVVALNINPENPVGCLYRYNIAQ